MSDPRIAIIGAGNLSSRRIYSNIGAAGGQIVGVCDSMVLYEAIKTSAETGQIVDVAYAEL